MTVNELKKLLDQFDGNMTVCLAKRSRRDPQYAHEVGRVEEMIIDPYPTNIINDLDERVVCIAIYGEIGDLETIKKEG